MFVLDDIILGATIAGTATSAFGAFGKSSAQEKLKEDELALEEVRRTQMRYDALRQQRQLVRNAQVSRSIALSNQTSSGASFGSAAGGAAGQAQGQQGVTSNAIYQNLQLGEKTFDLNRKIIEDKSSIQRGNDFMSLGSTIAGLGGPLSRMAGGFGGSTGAMAGTGADPTTELGGEWGYL